MRKLVIVVVLLFAVFTFIRYLPSGGSSVGSIPESAQIRSALIP